MSRLRQSTLTLLLALLVLLPAAVILPTHDLQAAASDCLDSQEAVLLDRINTYRSLHGEGLLSASPTLTAAARHHAASMATWDYFPSDYSVRFEGPGHDQTVTWQQNIANAGYPDNTHSTRSAIIGAGSSSPGAILHTLTGLPSYDAVLRDRRFGAIGIGFATNPQSAEGSYWVITFGSLNDGALEPCEGVRLQAPIVAGGRSGNSGSSNLAFDGDFTTDWATTGDGPPQDAYVWFDLGGPAQISAIEWMFSKSGAADRFAIDVSLDRRTWTQVALKTNGAVNEWRSLTWSGTARYVRFYFANPASDPVLGYLSEVRVFR